ncbi:MAG TPA: GntR family transcriptional regulator [Solirubrobacteraceae bacterium]|nr:GntR family transcriptional regulator [Solirubrobacteraceae bacterium]
MDSQSLQARAADQLREMIADGTLVPGANLSEVALAASFSISRTPIREALKQLSTEGLVEIVPRVGTFVAKPSLREIVELFQVKEVLEGLSARLLAQRGEVPELRALRRNVAESEQAVRTGHAERYAALVDEFHDLIAVGADNTKLLAAYRLLLNQLAYRRLVRTSLGRPGRLPRSVDEHARLLELIESKEPDGAESAMRSHVRASAQEVLAALRTAGESAREDGAEPRRATTG